MCAVAMELDVSESEYRALHYFVGTDDLASRRMENSINWRQEHGQECLNSVSRFGVFGRFSFVALLLGAALDLAKDEDIGEEARSGPCIVGLETRL